MTDPRHVIVLAEEVGVPDGHNQLALLDLVFVQLMKQIKFV